MQKKLMSTVALFAVFIGFLLWGGLLLASSLSSRTSDKENIVYALLLLGCSGYALVSILMLPRKNQS
jgi:TRAP-type C4-dicarboxylate transport system permease small subunit